jgi:DNA-binding CsgD family transcriptional regulator
MLLERRQECGRIDELLEAARSGRSGVLVIQADAGLGKTALLSYAASAASAMTVLRCRGFESESQLAFAGLSDLLRPVSSRLDALPDAQREALAGALALGPAPQGDRLTVCVGALSLLAASADEAPVLCIVDDAHWLDLASAEALAFVGRRLDADGVALLVAARADTAGMFQRGEFPTIGLAPLSPEAARELVQPVADGNAEDIVRLAGGNPLALIELAATSAGRDGSDTQPGHGDVAGHVQRAFRERIERLPPATATALLIAATADNDDAGVISRALAGSGLSMDDLEPAEQAGLIALGGGIVAFRHPLCRSAVTGGAGAADRRAAHAALAAAMHDPASADMRAWHLAAAALEPDEEVAGALEESAARARTIGAYASAVVAFERAAAMSPDAIARSRRLMMAADAAHMVGESGRSLDLLDQAARVAAGHAQGAEVERLRARVEARSGSSAAAHGLLRAAADLLEPTQPVQAALALIEAVEAAIRAGQPGLALEAAERARRLAGDATNPVGVFATLATAASCVFLGDSQRSLTLVRSAASAARETALDEQIRGYLGLVLAFSEEFDDGRQVLTELVQRARRQSAPGALEFPLISLAWIDRTTGRWTDAAASLHEGCGLAGELARRNDECWGLSILSWIEAAQGRDEQCRHHVARLIALHEQLSLPFQLAAAEAALGLLDLGAGRLEPAIEHLTAALAVKHAHGYCDATTYPPVAPELVDALVRAGRWAEALPIYERFAVEAAASGRASAHALACRASAMLAVGGAPEPAFEEALEAHSESHDAFAHARTQLAYGTALRRSGKRRASREQLAAALDTFEALRAGPWGAQVLDALDRSVQTMRKADASPDDLTPAEWQVAAAVEQGLTNKEIGAQLFMSHKTVEAHLTHIYGRLELRRRTELAGWVRKHQLSAPA